MSADFIAKAEVTIDASVATVWRALVDPATIKRYMFGTAVVSDWKEGSAIVWRGVWEGKPYEDKGVIVRMQPNRLLQVTHFSPLGGKPDVPANYHTLTYELSGHDDHTHLSLSQDNNADEKSRAHSQKMWTKMLVSLKDVLEEKSAAA